MRAIALDVSKLTEEERKDFLQSMKKKNMRCIPDGEKVILPLDKDIDPRDDFVPFEVIINSIDQDYWERLILTNPPEGWEKLDRGFRRPPIDTEKIFKDWERIG